MKRWESALTGRRVLDLADEKGLHCGKTLADLGADVIKIEPPEGDLTRRLGPFKDDIPHPERSLPFIYYNMNKRGLTLNLGCADGQAIFKKLVKTADIVLETFQPGVMESLGLGYQTLREVNPGVILTSITGFGQTGPYRDYQATDMVGFAMGGAMYISGDPNRPPCVAPGTLAYDTASAYAAVGTLIALYRRTLSGEGQHVDVSVQESVATTANFAIPIWSYEGVYIRRQGSTEDKLVPTAVYRCKDGHVRLMIVARPHHWRAVVEWIGSPQPLTDPFFDHLPNRAQNREFIEGYVIDFMKDYTKAELYEEGQRRHIPITPVNSPADFINDKQTKYRGYFIEMEHPEIRDFLAPGPTYQCQEAPWQLRRPAPRLGEHNEEIYVGELGYTKKDLVVLRACGVI